MRSIGSQPFLLTLHIKLCKRHMVASLQRSPHQESPSHCLCCRLRLGQLGRRCLQLLPNHRLLCQISSRKVHRSQIRLGWCGDSRPGWHHPDVPHPGLQCHAHECLGCHCYCWSAASSGLWARHFVVLGGFANLMLESDSTLMALYRYTPAQKAALRRLPPSSQRSSLNRMGSTLATYSAVLCPRVLLTSASAPARQTHSLTHSLTRSLARSLTITNTLSANPMCTQASETCHGSFAFWASEVVHLLRSPVHHAVQTSDCNGVYGSASCNTLGCSQSIECLATKHKSCMPM